MLATQLSQEAQSVLTLCRELKTLDDTAQRTLQQLFSHRLNEDLVSFMAIGKEVSLAQTLYKVVRACHAKDLLGYVLRFTADMSQICAGVGKAFASDPATGTFGGEDPVDAFLAAATTYINDAGIHTPALFMIATVIRYSAPGTREPVIEQFLQQCNRTFSSTALTATEVEYTMHSLSVFVRRRDVRTRLIDADILPHIPRTLVEACAGDSATIAQLTYETLITIWMLSFDYQCLVELHKHRTIPTVHRVLQRTSKEKCVRVALMILRNFCNAQRKYYASTAGQEWADTSIYVLGAVNRGKGPNFYAEMIGVGVMKTLWQLVRRKFGDEDIPHELEELSKVLEVNLDSVTSFTEYKGEVESGVLEWSPVHTSAKFWKENVTKFDENSYDVLRSLGQLILTSKNEVTLAVACHDLGEAVRYHPSGRLLLSVPGMGGVKEKVMTLMSHQNPDVAKNALLAVQKIMVQRWEFVK